MNGQSVSFPQKLNTRHGTFTIENITSYSSSGGSGLSYEFSNSQEAEKMERLVSKSGKAKRISRKGDTLNIIWREDVLSKGVSKESILWITGLMGIGGGVLYGGSQILSTGTIMAYFSPITIGLIILGIVLLGIGVIIEEKKIKRTGFSKIKDVLDRSLG